METKVRRKPASDVMLSETQLAEKWGLAKITLRKWRADRKGPPYTKLGNSVRYPADGAEAWMSARTVAA